MGLRIDVLGALRVGYDVEISLERASYRRLLSILALEANHRIGTDVLIDRFWGEAAPATAKAALQVHISALRKLLPSGLIVTEGYGYRLDLEGHGLDVDEFVALARGAQEAAATRRWGTALEATGAALALWRGDPYPELEDDDFARSEIARLREFHLELLEARAETLLGMGRDAQALPDLERLVVEHPLRERFWEHLMTARYRLGRYAEALEAYREAWSTFREIGLEPSASLTRLEQKILLHDTSLSAKVRNNLPVELTAFVGRERELAEVAELLAAHRMVTLTGVGGSGKTRLAVKVGALTLEGFPDGCWLAELAPILDPTLIAVELAAAIGLEPGADEVVQALVAAIGDDTALVLLDNCEHLLAGTAALSRALLEAGPDVKVLATSREPLRVPGEVAYEVPPMSFPVDGVGDPATLRAFDAVRLFEERASLAQQSFTLGPQNAAAVEKICRRLDGLPLAIELAAARVGSLGPATIAERLDDRFCILVGGSSTGAERHRTLEGALDWSYDLLDAREKLLFARLSVFGGGFTVEMAEEVCADDGIDPTHVVLLVSTLIEKSLVSVYEAETRPRYRLLETLREYASRRLVEIGDPAAARARHLDWCVRFADDFTATVSGSSRSELFDRLNVESDNLEAGLAWAKEHGNDDQVEVLARALAWRWIQDVHLSRGIALAKTALARCTSAEAEAEIRALLSWACFEAGDDEVAYSEAERAYALAAELEPSRRKLWVIAHLASLHRLLVDKDPLRAIPLSREVLATADALGDDVSRLRALTSLGMSLVWAGELDQGLEQYRAALELALSGGDPGAALDTYEGLLTGLYLHPVARRSEPARVVEEMLARLPLEERRREYGSGWLPWVHLQSGEWDRAEQVIDRIGSDHLEGWEGVGYLLQHAALRWMQGRLEEARSDLDELRQLRVNPRWYHDYYPLVADVAADTGRLADVRETAETYLAVEADPTEEAKKVGVLSPLARAEADAALAASESQRAEHVERIRAAVVRGHEILEEFPPPTEGSVQLETPTTYLAFAEAELSRATKSDPVRWQDAVDRADFFHFRLYARWRLVDALLRTDRRDEAVAEIRVAHADAVRVGSDGIRVGIETLASRAGISLAGDPAADTVP